MGDEKIDYWLSNAEQAEGLEYWMALNDYELEEGKLGIRRLLSEGKDISSFFSMNYGDVRTLFGNNAEYLWKDFNRIKSSININAYKKLKIDLLRSGCRIIKYNDKLYPSSLKRSEKLSPLVLYHKGSLLDFDNCVAIIGARNSSHYARQRAREMSKSLAKRGYTIVAGLALGIDTEAHCGALDVEGRTIAVIPNIDEIAPSSNLRLSEDIMRNGALLSSGSPFSKISRDKYVKRNKIISGLSDCLIAIESGESKGTYHQVRFALTQRLKVFALEPQENNRIAYSGFKQFLDMGAIPFTSENEIIDHLEHLKQQKVTS